MNKWISSQLTTFDTYAPKDEVLNLLEKQDNLFQENCINILSCLVRIFLRLMKINTCPIACKSAQRYATRLGH